MLKVQIGLNKVPKFIFKKKLTKKYYFRCVSAIMLDSIFLIHNTYGTPCRAQKRKSYVLTPAKFQKRKNLFINNFQINCTVK